MTVLETTKVLKSIQNKAEQIKSNATRKFPEAASIGDCWRQGDIYITLLDKIPNNYKETKNPNLQLAPGTTQGSRHCLDSLRGVTVYVNENPKMLDGPVLCCKKERTITHPEHGDVVLLCGIYEITYQRNLDSEEREQRVND